MFVEQLAALFDTQRDLRRAPWNGAPLLLRNCIQQHRGKLRDLDVFEVNNFHPSFP